MNKSLVLLVSLSIIFISWPYIYIYMYCKEWDISILSIWKFYHLKQKKEKYLQSFTFRFNHRLFKVIETWIHINCKIVSSIGYPFFQTETTKNAQWTGLIFIPGESSSLILLGHSRGNQTYSVCRHWVKKQCLGER